MVRRKFLPAVFGGLKLVAIGGLALTVLGCARMHIVCQDAGSTNLAVGGNTAGQQILSVGLTAASAAAAGAKFAQAIPQATPTPSAQSQSYVDYEYLPLFGPDYASCTTSPPLAPPTMSVVILSPNGTILQRIETDSRQTVVVPTTK